MDPNNETNDISGGSSNIALIFKKFSESYNLLQQRMALLNRTPVERRRGASILGTILGGDYSSFKVQRQVIARMHSTRLHHER